MWCNLSGHLERTILFSQFRSMQYSILWKLHLYQSHSALKWSLIDLPGLPTLRMSWNDCGRCLCHQAILCSTRMPPRTCLPPWIGNGHHLVASFLTQSMTREHDTFLTIHLGVHSMQSILITQSISFVLWTIQAPVGMPSSFFLPWSSCL